MYCNMEKNSQPFLVNISKLTAYDISADLHPDQWVLIEHGEFIFETLITNIE